MLDIAIVGGGLVGALEACLLAKRGFKVTIFEKRPDERNIPEKYGKSFNLAISYRGICALKLLGYESIVDEEAIPAKARMIHTTAGKTYAIPYDPDGRCINSIRRGNLNNILLNKAEHDHKVKILFNHKLVDMNADEGELRFEVRGEKKSYDENNDNQYVQLVRYRFDLIIGCDGSHSRVRSLLAARTKMELNESYIEHGYMEVPIDADESGSFKMPPNYLHIWPRGQYMMMALANKDSSFTCTLFMPFKIFDKLKDPKESVKFFYENFPDSVKLIGEERIKKFLTTFDAGHMVTVKCEPYYLKHKVVLLGDSAHAMVPFYGQGMNCGFEDCLVLEELFDKYLGKGSNFTGIDKHNLDINVLLERAFADYSEIRSKNGQAMCDLALYNYIEMRDLVNTWSFIIRKNLDKVLYRLFPTRWIPLYTMVTFSRIPVHECIKRREAQDRLLKRCFYLSSALALGGALVFGGARYLAR